MNRDALVGQLPNACELLGVIDLRAGQAVHAIAGMRDQYRPVHCPDATAGDAGALMRHYRALGVTSFYIADLDGILFGKPAWEVLRTLAKGSETLWLDVGLRAPKDLKLACDELRTPGEETVPDHQVTWIVATETAGIPIDWNAWKEIAGRSILALGLDVRRDQVIGIQGAVPGVSPEATVAAAAEAGIERCVILDLSAVGKQSGPNVSALCSRLKEAAPQVEIASGGGVRSAADVRLLSDSGCRWILVATALHPSAG